MAQIPGITVIDFARLDLNLLLTLDVLLDTLNVTRAAERLNLSQPAVSVQLGRLREHFDDPLLLPGPRGMRPTARALALAEPLRAALEALGQAVAPSAPFDPARATLTWKVAATDYGETCLVLPALVRLREQAPGTRLAVLELNPPRLAQAAEQGQLDLAFHTREGSPPGLHCRSLFHERYVLAGRAGHPGLAGALSLERFAELEHAIVSPDGGGFAGVTDQALASLGLQRRVVLSVPHFLFLRAALMQTDLVAMVPLRLVQGEPGLMLAEPPLPVPGYEMVMLWPERLHRDGAHRWLRECILAGLQ